jgi:hypothetical protein
VTYAQRFILTMTIALMILLAFALCGYLNNRWEPAYNVGFDMAGAQSTVVICADPTTREKVREIMTEALDIALKQHIVHMFEVWMKDDRGQPDRARVGVSNGIAAYIRASKSVATWSPPDCPG